MIKAVLNGIDQGSAIEQPIAAIGLDLVEAGGVATFVIAMPADEAGQARGIAAHPAVEGHDVGHGEHLLGQAARGLQALDQEPVELIGGADALVEGRSLIRTGQAAVEGIPGDQLIEAGASAAVRRGEIGGINAGCVGGGHGRGDNGLRPSLISDGRNIAFKGEWTLHPVGLPQAERLWPWPRTTQARRPSWPRPGGWQKNLHQLGSWPVPPIPEPLTTTGLLLLR